MSWPNVMLFCDVATRCWQDSQCTTSSLVVLAASWAGWLCTHLRFGDQQRLVQVGVLSMLFEPVYGSLQRAVAGEVQRPEGPGVWEAHVFQLCQQIRLDRGLDLQDSCYVTGWSGGTKTVSCTSGARCRLDLRTSQHGRVLNAAMLSAWHRSSRMTSSTKSVYV